MKPINTLIIICFFAFFIQCEQPKIDEDKTLLVKVYDKFLYYEDLEGLIPEGSTKEDSSVKVSNYVDLWVKKQLMMKKAELYLTDSEKDVERQIEDYRSSLMIYRYKQKFIEQKLDSVISFEDIKDYFNVNKQEFPLKENAFAGIYVKLLKSVPDINRLRYLLRSRVEGDSVLLRSFCLENAIKYDDFNGGFVALSQVTRELPNSILDPAQFLRTNSIVEMEDEEYMYFLKIKQYRLVGEIAPLKFVEDDIRSILLNKRKLLLIDELEQNVYQNAILQGNLEFFHQ